MDPHTLDIIQVMVVGITGLAGGWLTFRTKKVDGHISDNDSIQEMFKIQSELILQLNEKVTKLEQTNKELLMKLELYEKGLMKYDDNQPN